MIDACCNTAGAPIPEAAMTNPETAPFISSLAQHAADPLRLLVEAVVYRRQLE
jgi:hypothetical protein